MNGPLDKETRENLSMSHAASKNLLFTINDLLVSLRHQPSGRSDVSTPYVLTAGLDKVGKRQRNIFERTLRLCGYN